MKPRIVAAILLLFLMRSISAHAQFVGGSHFNGTDSLVATWSGKGHAVSVGFAALGVNPPNLQNLVGVVQLILGSSTACDWVMEDFRWTVIPNTQADGEGMCQLLYYRKFRANEHPPYRFRWFTPLTFDVRTYVISNVSGIDAASVDNGNGTVLTADGVTTSDIGDYLMAFYTTHGSGTWTPPPNMGIAVKNDYAYGGPANFPNLATQAWSYPAASTGNKLATISGNPAEWIANLVAFKPLYRIPPQTAGDINPGPIYSGCRGKVTLSNGAGTFSKSCVKATSFCQCRDTTQIDNSCTTANPSAGSVTLKGTGADAELINCM